MAMLSRFSDDEALDYFELHYGRPYDIRRPAPPDGWKAIHRESREELTARTAPDLLSKLRADTARRADEANRPR
jgi:hypothetical protein